MVSITLPDGATRTLARGARGLDLAAAIGARLARDAIAVVVDGELLDLRAPLERDAAVRVVTRGEESGLEVLRHSMAHAMAQAVLRLFPGASLAIGPTIADGFYYDVAVARPLVPDDLAAIEREMAKIVQADLPIERFTLARSEALAWARAGAQSFKVEIIEELPPEVPISFYRQGEFTDLCAGPHVQRTGQLGSAFKLMKVAGAYWRGDERREQLQRIYGTAFFRAEDLAEHLRLLAEAERRDHRRLGRELDLFSFHPEAPAMPFFHPRGALVYNLLIDYVRGLYRVRGYSEVVTPQILDVELWRQSGHYDNYRENMFFTAFATGNEDEPAARVPATGERQSAVKPMNCPTHCLIYRARKRSYRELPLRFADFGRIHRHERSGVTAGLFRVRSFAQDDAHIFCMPEQIEAEVIGVTEMILECYRTFGFDDVRIVLSTRPDKSIGSDEIWQRAEAALEAALERMGVTFQVAPGEGAFYGPKIDFVVKDALKREWQLGTCQLDFSMPERFGLKYTASSGEERTPVMVHRAMLGSLERFLGVLIEHTGGALPLWLAPVQALVLSIGADHAPRARELAAALGQAGFRVEADVRNEKIGLKVREASLAKVRYQLIIGAREAERGTVSVRDRVAGDLGEMDLERFQVLLRQGVAEKS